jgi:hypothetical protein
MICAAVFLLVLLEPVALADELTEIVQKDLVALGYDPGNTSGEMTTGTIVAISKFQAENDLEVTGEPTPQLAGIIKAKVNQQGAPGGSAQGGAMAAAPDPATLQAAQQACLQQKMAEAQARQEKKRGFGKLMSAVSRTATQFGNHSAVQSVAEVSADVYATDATARDLKDAAKDLGLKKSDVEECQNPPM